MSKLALYKSFPKSLVIIPSRIPSRIITRKKDNIAVELMSCLSSVFINRNRTITREILQERQYSSRQRMTSLYIYNKIGDLIIAFGEQDITTDDELNKSVKRLLNEIEKYKFISVFKIDN